MVGNGNDDDDIISRFETETVCTVVVVARHSCHVSFWSSFVLFSFVSLLHSSENLCD